MESTGSGHRRAAEAIEAEFGSKTDVDAEVVNIVDHMNDALHSAYQMARTQILETAPHVVGQMYSWYDGAREERTLVGRALSRLQRQSMRGVAQLLEDFAPDVVVHTHFFPAQLIAELRREGSLTCPHVTVTTDLFSHGMWLNEPCERFFVATEEARVYLEHFGAPAHRVRVAGIPVMPGFTKRRRSPVGHNSHAEARMAAIQRRYVLPHILLMASGIAPDMAQEALRSAVSTQLPLRITVLAGANRERRDALAEVELPERHVVELHGYRDDVDRLLMSVDVLAGKSGGLTAAECTTMGIPMAILRPRPDQEEQNTDFLLERGAAVRVSRIPLLPHKIDEMFSPNGSWADLTKAAHALGRPRAAVEVADDAAELARSYRAGRLRSGAGASALEAVA